MSKIPQGEWSAIAARYAQGESLSAIARSYGCTPPAIHYVLKRNERQTAEKADKVEKVERVAKVEPPVESGSPGSNDPPGQVQAPTQRPNGEIKLSLNRANEPIGEGSRGTARPAIGLLRSEHQPAAIASTQREPQTAAITSTPREHQPVAIASTQREHQPVAIGSTRSEPPLAEPQRQPRSSYATGRAVAFTDGLDSELHQRAEAAIERFRSCFDAALAEGSPQERARLRQAASDLMRVAARTTIVLDRLNALSDRAAARFDLKSNNHRPA
jgi:hypothetical protein